MARRVGLESLQGLMEADAREVLDAATESAPESLHSNAVAAADRKEADSRPLRTDVQSSILQVSESSNTSEARSMDIVKANSSAAVRLMKVNASAAVAGEDERIDSGSGSSGNANRTDLHSRVEFTGAHSAESAEKTRKGASGGAHSAESSEKIRKATRDRQEKANSSTVIHKRDINVSTDSLQETEKQLWNTRYFQWSPWLMGAMASICCTCCMCAECHYRQKDRARLARSEERRGSIEDDNEPTQSSGLASVIAKGKQARQKYKTVKFGDITRGLLTRNT